jgi:hypothetical protein
MCVTLPNRRLVLLLVAAFFPTLAFAINQTYEGTLKPDNREAPMSIVVEVKDLGELIAGKVKIGAPLNVDGQIDYGRAVSGQCNMSIGLSKFVKLRLYGTCEQTVFKGNYTIYDGRENQMSGGTFNLAGKSSKLEVAPSTGNVTACVKANTKCLNACPRDDNTTELLCANHCRARFQACKDKVRKPGAAGE